MRLFLLISLVYLSSCQQECSIGLSQRKDQINNKCCLEYDSLLKVIDKDDDDCVAENYLYLSLDNIYNGKSWIDTNNNRQVFYRVLFSSIEESSYIHVELIEVTEDGPLKFISRKKVLPKSFGLDYYNGSPTFVDWVTKDSVNIRIDSLMYLLPLRNF
jgi:hypothetical protein